MPASAQDGSLTGDGFYVALTEQPLDVAALMQRVRSPKAGANVLFAGSTRDNFEGRPVATLVYAAYGPRALRTMRDIATDVRTKHGMLSVAVVHRLGTVPIGEDSILIAASAPHRQAAWRGAEECLERVKERVEVWKQEVFAADGARGTEDAEGVGAAANAAVAEGGERVWRANCGTTASGKPVPAATTAPPLETSEDGKSTQRS